MTQAIVNKVKNRIYAHGRGWVFTPAHFTDLGSDTGVRTALSRLQQDGVIRRVAQGIYDYPRSHKVFGVLSPSVDEIAKAVAERNGARIQPAGAYAANLIGLSEQVPGRVLFLTDGPSSKVKVGKLDISFRKTTVRNMFGAGSKEALVIHALKFMKEKHINKTMLNSVRKFLLGTSRKEFEKNTRYAPQWIRKLLFDLMECEI